MTSQWRRRLLVLLFVVLAFTLGSAAREQLGLSFTAEGLQGVRVWVQDLGWWGPLVFICLAIFRLFIGLSSHLVLILGGTVFGVVGGMVWGSVGLVLSALILFFLARVFGAYWVKRRFGDQYKSKLARIKRLGAIATFAITAHPLGLLTPAHLAAGLAGLKLRQFVIAVVLAVPIRVAPFVFLGTVILDLSLTQSLAIAGIKLVVFVLPLLSPKFREWVWGA